jgi:hypothetical protein
MSDLFDDLRNEGSGAMRFDEEEEAPVAFTDFSNFDNYDDLDDDPRPQEDRPRASRRKGKGFLGMTAGQRFVLAFLLFVLSLIFSSACLLVTGRILI